MVALHNSGNDSMIIEGLASGSAVPATPIVCYAGGGQAPARHIPSMYVAFQSLVFNPPFMMLHAVSSIYVVYCFSSLLKPVSLS